MRTAMPGIGAAVRMMRPVLACVMSMLRALFLPRASLERQQRRDIVNRLRGQVERPVALFLREVLVRLAPLEADLELALQLLRVVLLERRDEGRRYSRCARAPRAPNAVNKIVRAIRQVEVDDVRNIRDVDLCDQSGALQRSHIATRD